MGNEDGKFSIQKQQIYNITSQIVYIHNLKIFQVALTEKVA